MPVALVAEAVPGVLAHAMQGEDAGAGNVFLIAPQDHAALAGHHVLGDVEAEAPEIAKGASRAPPVFGFDGMGAIFDHDQPIFVSNGHDPVHVAGAACEVNRQNGPRARGDGGLDGIGIDVLGHRIHIGQHRGEPGVQDGIDRRAESQGRGDDLAARLQPCRHHAYVQGRRTRVDGSDLGVPHTAPSREIALELGHAGPGAQPARTQASLHLGDLSLLDTRGTKDQERGLGIGRHRRGFWAKAAFLSQARWHVHVYPAGRGTPVA